MRHTSFKLELAGKNVHQKLHNAVCRAEHLVEKNESDHNRLLVVEAKGLVQAAIVDENTEQREDVEQVEASNA